MDSRISPKLRRFSAALWSLLCDAHATLIARLHRRCADRDPRVIHCRFGLWPVASGAPLCPGGQLLQGFVCPSIGFNVRFQRIYRDEEKGWRSTDSFGRDDLLVLAKVADQAHGRIVALSQQQRPQEA